MANNYKKKYKKLCKTLEILADFYENELHEWPSKENCANYRLIVKLLKYKRCIEETCGDCNIFEILDDE